MPKIMTAKEATIFGLQNSGVVVRPRYLKGSSFSFDEKSGCWLMSNGAVGLNPIQWEKKGCVQKEWVVNTGITTYRTDYLKTDYLKTVYEGNISCQFIYCEAFEVQVIRIGDVVGLIWFKAFYTPDLKKLRDETGLYIFEGSTLTNTMNIWIPKREEAPFSFLFTCRAKESFDQLVENFNVLRNWCVNN